MRKAILLPLVLVIGARLVLAGCQVKKRGSIRWKAINNSDNEAR